MGSEQAGARVCRGGVGEGRGGWDCGGGGKHYLGGRRKAAAWRRGLNGGAARAEREAVDGGEVGLGGFSVGFGRSAPPFQVGLVRLGSCDDETRVTRHVPMPMQTPPQIGRAHV